MRPTTRGEKTVAGDSCRVPTFSKARLNARRWLSVSSVPPDLLETTTTVRDRSPPNARSITLGLVESLHEPDASARAAGPAQIIVWLMPSAIHLLGHLNVLPLS